MGQKRFTERYYYPDNTQLKELKSVCEGIFSNLKQSIENKKELFAIIQSEKRELKSKDIVLHQKPEPFTKRIVIQPLLKALGFDIADYGKESEQKLSDSRRWADYTLKTEGEDVLIEAEPLNKDLYAKKCGVEQVREWILSKKTKTNFGIATDGFIWIMLKFDENTLKMRELKTINLRPVFLEFINQQLIEKKAESILKEFYSLLSKQSIILAFNEVSFRLEEFQEDISQRFYSQYMDYIFGINSRTGSLSRDYSLLTAIKTPDKNEENLRLFAVTFMNRIFFIKFLEDKGLVDKELLRNLWIDYNKIRESLPNTFYKTYLQPLFFGVFDTPIKKRDSSVLKIRHFINVPYLNGGLFCECVSGEKEYDIEDDILEKILIEFIETYDFTLSSKIGLDPDILGYIFEKTINYITKLGTNRQKAVGAYYTPDDVTTYIAKNTINPYLIKKIRNAYSVNGWKESELRNYKDFEYFLSNPPRNSGDIKKAIDIIKTITILDPACGSGHFLTTALKELVYIQESLLNTIREEYSLYHIKRDIIGRNLFGVDIEPTGVEIAKLRLWLSLIEDIDISKKEHIETLPNIEYNVLSGDSLVGWIGEPTNKKPLMKLIDHPEIVNLLEQLKKDYEENQEIITMLDDAINNFSTYETNEIIKSYTQIKDLYPLESSDKAVNLRKTLSTIREYIYEFIGQNYAIYLTDKIYPNKKKKKRKNNVITPEYIRKSFHWKVDFYPIIERGGFDIIIGNPPYIEKSQLEEYLQKVLGVYNTESCGNTHAYFFERSFSILIREGYCSLIVPISAISTDRMHNLQDLLMQNSSNLKISNYDDRPGKIFKDLEDCRSSIIISNKSLESDVSTKIYTTTYNIWYTQDRENLFKNINYVESKKFVTSGSIPKLGEEIEKTILQKVNTNTQLKNYLNGENEKGKIWYHNAPRYWNRALNFIPYFWNERDGEKISNQLKEINVKLVKYREIVTSIINSSLFYWYFILYSDARHLNLREIENFPISLEEIDDSIFQELNKTNQNLMKDYKKNAKRKECTYTTTGKVKYDEFFPGKSKHIMDKIDDLLSKHYKFNSEESEFIKNFSLTFRIGNSYSNK